MKSKSYAPALTATALIGLAAFALSGSAIAADNSMSHSGGMMSHNSMSGSMSKSRVKAIQSALKKKGMDVKTDGIMGPSTMSALRKYQKKNDLKVTGHPDKATCKSLGISMGSSSMSSNSMSNSGS